MPTVFTFNVASLSEKHGKNFRYIYTDEQKARLLTSLGIENIVSVDFGEVCELSGEEFINEILVKKLNAACVVCGNDYRFGKDAACGVNELEALCRPYGIEVIKISDVENGGDKISSQLIRELLGYGAITTVTDFLGRRYFISQTVETGSRIGRTIGYPTINQHFTEGQLVPKYGVYATEVTIDDVTYKAVTNIGVKPTVTDDNKVVAETYILEFCGDLYGKSIRVYFENFMRGEKKFGSVEELKATIHSDIQHRLSL